MINFISFFISFVSIWLVAFLWYRLGKYSQSKKSLNVAMGRIKKLISSTLDAEALDKVLVEVGIISSILINQKLISVPEISDKVSDLIISQVKNFKPSQDNLIAKEIGILEKISKERCTCLAHKELAKSKGRKLSRKLSK